VAYFLSGDWPTSRAARPGSDLHGRHKVYLDLVTIGSVPEHYQERLVDLFPGEFLKLRLLALEKHDLVLAKLARNIDRDREDVKRLAAGPGLDPTVLRERYHAELRYQFGSPDREDLTLELWLEIIQEVSGTCGAQIGQAFTQHTLDATC
jgi:hypothetical protein